MQLELVLGKQRNISTLCSHSGLTRIRALEEKWGGIWFKGLCKHCHIHVCFGESVLFGIILSHTLKLHPDWSEWSCKEPSDRKRRGRPTEKRVEKRKAKEIDARPFPNQAAPRAPLRVREMD